MVRSASLTSTHDIDGEIGSLAVYFENVDSNAEYSQAFIMQLAKAKDAAKKLGVDILSSDWPYNFLQSQKLKSHPITILCYHTLRPDDDPIDAWTALR
ncbi:MAG TPA: hypothetical protein VKA94_13590, partial [Hyphomicrobiales bacterium]|nr:hypothetical protein [Hyphomicrobiales bacterium]